MSDLRYVVDGAVATLTLDRPEARNAFTEAMVTELVAALDEAEADDVVRSVVLTGAGPAFCAGGDLKAMRERTGMFAGDPAELRTRYRLGLQQLPRRFDAFEKPVVAAVGGAAIGAGLDLALMADLRICDRTAKLGSTFARVGLIPGDGGAYLLARAIGLPRALDLVLTARVVDADEALAMGLVTAVVDAGTALDAATARAQQIARLPAKAVQAAKACLYRVAHQDLETALHLTAALQATVQHTDEHAAAVEALLEQMAGR